MEWLVSVVSAGETVLLCALPKVGKSNRRLIWRFQWLQENLAFKKLLQGKVFTDNADASLMSLKQELMNGDSANKIVQMRTSFLAGVSIRWQS